jgi:hypothetical protein
VKHDDRVGSEPFIAGSTPTLEPMLVQAPPRHCQAIGDPWSKRQRRQGPRDGGVACPLHSQYTDTFLHGHKIRMSDKVDRLLVVRHLAPSSLVLLVSLPPSGRSLGRAKRLIRLWQHTCPHACDRSGRIKHAWYGGAS